MSDDKEIVKSSVAKDQVVRLGPSAEIVSKVKYTYVTIAQVMTSNLDVRIAFGDLLPPDGRADPLFGIAISHDHARKLLRALESNLKKYDAAMLNLPPEIMKQLEANEELNLAETAGPNISQP